MSALLRRLADDDLDVVAAVLASKAALQVPATGLLEAVEAAMSRAWQALHRKEQGVSSSKALSVIKSVSTCHISPQSCPLQHSIKTQQASEDLPCCPIVCPIEVDDTQIADARFCCCRV